LLDAALQGVHTACYLVHSMGGPGDFEELDRRAAVNFAESARAAGVQQIVYLGGLGRDQDLSPHLASRHEVGRLLRDHGVATVELRASIVIGSGSASFETVRALVERLPVIVAPRWVETLAQPIAVEDVIDHLLAAIEFAHPVDEIYEIGGADQVTYAEVMREYARQRGLRRRVVRMPLVTPRASRVLLGLLTPVYGRIAAAMVESLRNETIVTRPAKDTAFPVSPRGLSAAIERALVNEDREFAETRCSDALPQERPLRWGGLPFGRRLVASRVVHVGGEPEEAFAPIQRIGGSTGWYAADWFWRLRGFLDTLRGGVGLRRGRRDPEDLRVGDTGLLARRAPGVGPSAALGGGDEDPRQAVAPVRGRSGRAAVAGSPDDRVRSRRVRRARLLVSARSDPPPCLQRHAARHPACRLASLSVRCLSGRQAPAVLDSVRRVRREPRGERRELSQRHQAAEDLLLLWQPALSRSASVVDVGLPRLVLEQRQIAIHRFSQRRGVLA
jgi:uncharacterized protein YbjT (DUF2867 family)